MVYITSTCTAKWSGLAALDGSGELLFNRSTPSDSDAVLHRVNLPTVSYQAGLGSPPTSTGRNRPVSTS